MQGSLDILPFAQVTDKIRNAPGFGRDQNFAPFGNGLCKNAFSHGRMLPRYEGFAYAYERQICIFLRQIGYHSLSCNLFPIQHM
jgi:hypothetical protein